MYKFKTLMILASAAFAACSENDINEPVSERSELITGKELNLLCKNDLDIATKTPFPDMIKNNIEGVFEIMFRPVSNRETYYNFLIDPELENGKSFIVAKQDANTEYFKTLPAETLNITLEWSLSNMKTEDAKKYYIFGIPGTYPVQGNSMVVQTPQILSNSNIEQQFTHNLIQSEINAIDIAAPLGSNVIAFKGGRVVWTESRYGDYGCKNSGFISAGNSIFILHDDGTEARYLHLKKNSIKVSVGQIIHDGQLLAQVGNSGPSTGAHLHFQVGGFVNEELVSFPILFKLFSTETPWIPYYLQKVESTLPELRINEVE